MVHIVRDNQYSEGVLGEVERNAWHLNNVQIFPQKVFANILVVYGQEVLMDLDSVMETHFPAYHARTYHHQNADLSAIYLILAHTHIIGATSIQLDCVKP